jgi:3-oxoacyl-[acyl-carrier-protein] synthase III
VIIQSVAFRTPSRRLTNADVLDDIRDYNRTLCSAEQLEKYCAKVQRLFVKSGAATRYIRNKKLGERGFDLVVETARSALDAAGLAPGNIDLIIHCGVGRGFLEPANAAFLAKALGVNCDSFDVVDACMSWVRAAHVAQSFFQNKTYSNALVVNAEFTAYEHGLPHVLRVLSDDQLKYTFPALTIGEATTATVLTASPRHWDFRFRSAPEFAPLCNVPLPGFEDFSEPDDRLGLNGLHQLVSFGAELSKQAVRSMVEFIRDVYKDTSGVDVWFPHAMAGPIISDTATKLGIGPKLYAGVFERYGNIISASLPASIFLSAREGRLARGDTFVLCPATAGMAFALVQAEY